MQRRTLLKLSVTTAALVAIVGGTAALIKPGLDSSNKLTPAGREVFRAIGLGVLEKTLPEGQAEQSAELTQLLVRVEGLVSGLPHHAQAELSQLLSILATGAGRRALAGLSTPWAYATAGEVQAALQDMRLSSLAVRQQAYGALHDITAGAYFSDASAWPILGYPGPTDI